MKLINCLLDQSTYRSHFYNTGIIHSGSITSRTKRKAIKLNSTE